MSSHISLSAGTLCLGAGAYGYLKTKSKPSFIGGAVLASMFFSATYLMRKTDHQFSGHSLSALAGSIALFIGAKRFNLKTSGVHIGPTTLLFVGVLTVPYGILKAYEWR